MTEQPEPTTKQEILELIQDEKGRLEVVLGTLTNAQMLAGDLEGGRSVKDILWHIADSEKMMIQWISESYAGSVPKRPAPGEAWGDLDQINEQIFQENKERELSEVLSASDTAYEKALETVKGMSDQDLFDGERFAWRNGDPMWHMVAANTWWHYKEHREQVEAWLRRK